MYAENSDGGNSGKALGLVALALAVVALGFGITGLVLPPTDHIGETSDSYSAFEPDGTLVFVGNATVWNDINFEALSLGRSASAPDLIPILGSGGLEGVAFDGQTTLEQLFSGSEILHDYKEGSNIYPHIHWMPSTADAGNVTWFFEYSWTDTSGSFSAPTTLNVTQAAGGAWVHQRADFQAINGTGMNIGSHIIFRLYRNPDAPLDNYIRDAVLLSVAIHYESDTVGSRTISSK